MGKPKLQHYRIDVERLRSLLRGRREAMGLTMAQLAERAGVAPATVHKLEAGKLSVHLDKFIQVVDALSLSFGDIFSFDGSATAEPPDPLAAKLAKALRDGDQAAVLRLLAENASTPKAGDSKRRSKS